MTPFVLELRKAKINSSKFSDRDRPVSLMFDEMSLKSKLEFNPVDGKVVGFEDYGHGKRTGLVAKHALCSMIQGISTGYKQLVGYAFTASSSSSPYLKDFVFQTIEKINSTGLKVLSIVTDQGNNFYSFFRSTLGVTPDKPYFEHLGYRIYVLADVPHLVKSFRNCAYSYFIKNGEFKRGVGYVHHDLFKSVYDVCNESNLNYIPKITYNYIHLPSYGGKMKVKLATQVLSNSMYVAIITLLQ